MRVAGSAQDVSWASAVDQRFGRCRYFVVCNTDTGAIEVHNNVVNLNATQGAGIQAAANVAELGVTAVLTGHVGPNAFRALTAANIAVYTGCTGTVSDAVDAMVRGEISPAASADAESHGGF